MSRIRQEEKRAEPDGKEARQPDRQDDKRADQDKDKKQDERADHQADQDRNDKDNTGTQSSKRARMIATSSQFKVSKADAFPTTGSAPTSADSTRSASANR